MWCLSIFVLTKSLYSFVKIMYASCQGDGIVLHVHRQTLVFTTQIGKWSCYMHGFLAPAYKTLVFVFCVAFPTMNAKSTACVFHSIASCSQSQPANNTESHKDAKTGPTCEIHGFSCCDGVTWNSLKIFFGRSLNSINCIKKGFCQPKHFTSKKARCLLLSAIQLEKRTEPNGA